MEDALIELEESLLLKSNEITLDHQLFSPKLRIEMEKLLKAGLPNLLILENFTLDYAILTANLFNNNWGVNSSMSEDVFIAYPSEERWSIDEIKSEIIQPISLTPYNRHYLIVTNAESIDKRGYDKLLKTFEEPVSPTTFILLVNEASVLPKTILSRTQNILKFDKEDENFYFQNLGVNDPNLIKEVQRLSGANLSLGKILLGDSEILELARRVFEPDNWRPAQKITSIVDLEREITALALSWDKGILITDGKLTTPTQRAKVRSLLNLGIEVFLSNHRQSLNNYSASLAGIYESNENRRSFRGFTSNLEVVKDVKSYNRFNVNIRSILISLLLKR